MRAVAHVCSLGLVACVQGTILPPESFDAHQASCAEPCGESCCAPEQSCVDGACVPTCLRDCVGRDCGPDGCGGHCGPLPGGACQSGFVCFDGLCGCAPDCSGRECGPDGCGGHCGSLAAGTCPGGVDCVDGTCVANCEPDCTDRECGADGCGGHCGPLPLGACPSGFGCSDGTCVAGCEPQCEGRQCGPDGCGGECGDCWSWVCEQGTCVRPCDPDCAGRDCGPDACGGTCGPLFGACPTGSTCDGSGVCAPDCVPQCTGRECGDDGCGGSCAPGCGPYQDCDASGHCTVTCTPDCDGRECGPDGCGGECEPGCSNAACDADGQCGEPTAVDYCSQYSNVNVVDLPWGGFIDTWSSGGFLADGVLVGRITVPASAAGSGGLVSAVEFVDNAPTQRIMAMSPSPCDFRGFVPGVGVASDPTGVDNPIAWGLGVNPNIFFDITGFGGGVQLDPGRLYYVSIRNVNFNDGSTSCPTPTCNMRVTLNTPR